MEADAAENDARRAVNAVDELVMILNGSPSQRREARRRLEQLLEERERARDVGGRLGFASRAPSR